MSTFIVFEIQNLVLDKNKHIKSRLYGFNIFL